jgi:hypothetical protein
VHICIKWSIDQTIKEIFRLFNEYNKTSFINHVIQVEARIMGLTWIAWPIPLLLGRRYITGSNRGVLLKRGTLWLHLHLTDPKEGCR